MLTPTSHLLIFAGARKVTSLLLLTFLLLATSISILQANTPPEPPPTAPQIPPERPSTIDRALTRAPIVLRGPQSSHQTVIELHEASRDVSLHLEGASSEVASPERSTLSVWVDDIPIQTSWIARVSKPDHPHRWELTTRLGRLEPGFHRIRIESILHNDQDPCFQRQPEEAWTRIDSLTVRAPEPALQLEHSLANFPAAWRPVALNDVPAPHHVIVRLPRLPDRPEALQAYLRADALLRSMGYLPALEIGEPGKKSFHSSHMKNALDATTAGELELALAPPDGDDFTTLSLERQRVRIEAPDWSGIESGLDALRRPALLAHCTAEMASACRIHHLRSPWKPRTLEEIDQDDPSSRVQTLESLGFIHGWVAQDIGEHVLQTTWRKPGNWKITTSPTYLIKLHTSMTKRWIDTSSSALHLSLNGMPLEQFPVHKLDQHASGEALLRVKIPSQFWDEDVWTFKLTVVLREAPRLEITTKCSRVHQTQAWLRLEPQSGLWVPREVHHHHGLSTLAHGTPPALSWTQGLEIDHVEALGALLHPLAMQHAPLAVVHPSMCARTRCIEPILYDTDAVDSEGALPRPFTLEMTKRGPGLLDESGAYDLPVIPARRTILLDYVRSCQEEEQAETCETLTIWMPRQLEPLHPISAPDYGQIQGHQALHVHGLWHLSPLQGEVREVKHVRHHGDWPDPSERKLRGEKAQQRYLINVLWVLSLLLSAVAIYFYYKRRTRAQPMEDFDPRGYEDLEIHQSE